MLNVHTGVCHKMLDLVKEINGLLKVNGCEMWSNCSCFHFHGCWFVRAVLLAYMYKFVNVMSFFMLMSRQNVFLFTRLRL